LIVAFRTPSGDASPEKIRETAWTKNALHGSVSALPANKANRSRVMSRGEIASFSDSFCNQTSDAALRDREIDFLSDLSKKVTPAALRTGMLFNNAWKNTKSQS